MLVETKIMQLNLLVSCGGEHSASFFQVMKVMKQPTAVGAKFNAREGHEDQRLLIWAKLFNNVNVPIDACYANIVRGDEVLYSFKK